MPEKSEEVYRVISSNGGKTDPILDPKKAGETYKYARKRLSEGESVELQKSTLGPWETVEKESQKEKQ
jgi:hypothetical protein